MSTDLSTQISSQIDRIAAGEATADEALMFMNKVALFKAATKELASRAEQALIAYIDLHGDLDAGDRRYYVGTEKKTTVIDKEDALKALAAACGGDIAQMASYLTSEPFKPGACRTLGMDSHFVTETKKDLKDGAPIRKVVATQGEQW